MTDLEAHGRELVLAQLRRELVGPAPDGVGIDCSTSIRFENWNESYGPWFDVTTGEEIITRDVPTKRYGVGVLYPYGAGRTDDEMRLDESGADSHGMIASDTSDSEVHGASVGEVMDGVIDGLAAHAVGDADNDFDLSLANSYRPSSIGLSCLVTLPQDSRLVVEASGGRYEPKVVHIGEAASQVEWWVRVPVSLYAEFASEDLCGSNEVLVTSPQLPLDRLSVQNSAGLDLRVEILSRPYGDNPDVRLLTICLVNRTSAESYDNAACLFQAWFAASARSTHSDDLILPYPEVEDDSRFSDDEQRGLQLLYRNYPTFAVGHGCAADWVTGTGSGLAHRVSAEILPEYQVPSVTPDISDEEGRPVSVPIAPLAGLVDGDDGMSRLERFISIYEAWIEERWAELRTIDDRHQVAAQSHLKECERCARRMRQGWHYLANNSTAKRAFELANHAILLQQAASSNGLRAFGYDRRLDSLHLVEPYQEPDPMEPGPNRGSWRAFQIAFLLMTVESAAEGTVAERETVELIWFPTGGGKTEAYLGLLAFALFVRRLRDPRDRGVHAIMRYTLRLLSTQQFQRAARLICAMEELRRQNRTDLGEDSFSVGLWVGGDNTPNTRRQAIQSLDALLDRKGRAIGNKFVLDSCPWCGAQMGPIELPKNSKQSRVQGYYKYRNKTVRFECPDASCKFSSGRGGLPIHVVDEDLYELRPSLIIGTVDKFASLAWKPEARSLFGIDEDGGRSCSPPGLIVQDELHLISGPLGSTVGLYEAVIEELCTDRRGQVPIKPKIVSSTATIRRYKEQIKALYGRGDVVLFPPPGLDIADSFFARYAKGADGQNLPGRKYVGVHAPGLGSLQTVQVRSFTALLQAPMAMPDDARDPWWTLMVFFNSLRELGTSLSLLESDIIDYQKVLIGRNADREDKWRSFWNVMELTGRASGEDIPKSISKLSVSYPQDEKPQPIDVCLSSSILEAGIDISRLSLMCIVGQPKTTAQYIQVTGRVGRLWWERPGLIVTLYSASKPRDRSHFEKFRSYHERLYSQVEPSSVTPFSPPALDRALHAVMVAYVRQTMDTDDILSPYPCPDAVIADLHDLLRDRISEIDPHELANFEKVFHRRTQEWRTWQKEVWSAWDVNENALMRGAGSYVPPMQRSITWMVPLSMRNVDAECVTELLLPPNDYYEVKGDA